MIALKTSIGIVLMASFVAAIGFIFWHQEMKYLLPTPVPENLKSVAMGDLVDLNAGIRQESAKPLFIHFYNFDCSCSRFNAKDFRFMYYKYRDSVEFVALIQSSDPTPELQREFQDMMGVPIKTLVDAHGKIAKELGIYATPQAVIMDTTSRVFYKGNYNASRYCTSRTTKFAEMALQDILGGKKEPRFVDSYEDIPYGCLIPAYEKPQITVNVY